MTVPISDDDLDVYYAVLRESHALTDDFNREARAFRNRLVIMMTVTWLAAGLLLLMQWRFPHVYFIPAPTDTPNLSSWSLLLIVMGVGVIGAVITTVPAMARIPRVQTPFMFPLQQAFLKFALGTLTAVAGVVLLGKTSITNAGQSIQGLIGLAILFGASQQAVTQAIDTQAKAIISKEPTS